MSCDRVYGRSTVAMMAIRRRTAVNIKTKSDPCAYGLAYNTRWHIGSNRRHRGAKRHTLPVVRILRKHSLTQLQSHMSGTVHVKQHPRGHVYTRALHTLTPPPPENCSNGGIPNDATDSIIASFQREIIGGGGGLNTHTHVHNHLSRNVDAQRAKPMPR